MKLILKFIHLFSMTIWFGGVVFLSFFLAPVVFSTFSKDQAGDIMSAIFPGFYLMGYIAGFTTLISLLLLSKRGARFRLFLILIMLLATLYGGLVAGKKADHLRQEIKYEQNNARALVLKENFHTQHRLSFASNMIVLILIPTVILLTARNFSES